MDDSILPRDHLIVFDGVCTLCNTWAAFVVRHDQREAFRFVHLQSDLGHALYRHAGLDPEALETFMVFSNGRHFVRSNAVLQVFHELGGLWRILTLFKLVPESWRDTVYSFVANRRYRWFGKCKACPVPPGDLSRRFLN